MLSHYCFKTKPITTAPDWTVSYDYSLPDSIYLLLIITMPKNSNFNQHQQIMIQCLIQQNQ